MTRKWFQIHLSTAIALMLIAGALIPVCLSLFNSILKTYTYENDAEPFFSWVKPLATVLAFIIFLTTLLLSAVVSEFFIRRRETRKP
jgi:hypothetical protein